MRVRALPRGRALRVPLDPEGTGRLDLPARARRAQVSFRVRGGETFRIGGFPLD
jgi:hypothetical protein